MDFRILGPVEVRDDDGPLMLGGRKQRALLAVLLLHGNQVLSTDSLISALWDDSPPETAATALQGYVSQLRGTGTVKEARRKEALTSLKRFVRFLRDTERMDYDAADYALEVLKGRG